VVSESPPPPLKKTEKVFSYGTLVLQKLFFFFPITPGLAGMKPPFPIGSRTSPSFGPGHFFLREIALPVSLSHGRRFFFASEGPPQVLSDFPPLGDPAEFFLGRTSLTRVFCPPAVPKSDAFSLATADFLPHSPLLVQRPQGTGSFGSPFFPRQPRHVWNPPSGPNRLPRTRRLFRRLQVSFFLRRCPLLGNGLFFFLFYPALGRFFRGDRFFGPFLFFPRGTFFFFSPQVRDGPFRDAPFSPLN